MPEESITDAMRTESTVEHNIKAVWEEALKIHNVPNVVPFLDLGGDSLAAMVCIARIRKLFNVEFTIDDFFMDTSTVAEFTRIVQQSLGPS